MRCRCCGDTVRCAGCGAKADSSQSRWARRQERNGRCPRCRKKKSPADLAYVNCRDCRLKNAARMKARYATHGRKDRHRQAA